MQTAQATATTLDADMLERLRVKLSEYDIRFLIDKTGSMGGSVVSSNPKGQTRWSAIQEVVRDMVKVALSIDDDGVEVGFFSGSNFPVEKITTADQVDAIFNKYTPGGGTYLAPALNQMFQVGAGGKKDLLVVALDGDVADRDETIAQLVAQANRQTSDNDCTVIFLQIGDDAEATAFLKMLDDDLQSKYGAKFDIVDTITVKEAGSKPLVQVLAEGIVG